MSKEEALNSLEKALIDRICDSILEGFVINKELLYNWQVELLDSSNDFAYLVSIIEQEVIIVPCVELNPNESTKADIEELFKSIESFDDEIYHDFKTIVLELLIYGVTVSYTNRIRMCNIGLMDILITNFLEYSTFETTLLEVDLRYPLCLNQIGRLIVILCELGCNMKSLKKLVFPLFDESIENFRKILLLNLLNGIYSSNTYNSDFLILLNFEKSSVQVPFAHDIMFLKCFTIHSTFKIHQMIGGYRDIASPTMTLFLFTDSSIELSFLKIVLLNLNQIAVEIEDKRICNKSLLTFNENLQLLGKGDQGFVTITLTYDNYLNLNLYVNGRYSESIPCPDLYKALEKWDKVYIGNEVRRSSGPESDVYNRQPGYYELILRDLTVLNADLSAEWIYFLYNLGEEYTSDIENITPSEVANMINHLTYKEIFNVVQYIEKLYNDRKKESSKLDFHKRSSETRPFQGARSQNNPSDRSIIIKQLSGMKRNDICVMFKTDDNQYLRKLEASPSQPILLHRSESLYTSFYSIGGTPLLLRLIEVCLNIEAKNSERLQERETILHETIALLFTLINNNWRFSKEFENIHGYGLLLVLLIDFKENFNKRMMLDVRPSMDFMKPHDISGVKPKDLLDTILSYSGYNFADPYSSAVINKLAFRMLIFSFDVFAESDSLIKALNVVQILVFSSQYSERNRIELIRMKVLKKLILFLSSAKPSRSQDMEAFILKLNQTFETMLNFDSTIETIRNVSLFIIHSLYHPSNSSSEEYAIAALSSLTRVFCYSNTSERLLKKFSKSISVHWLLLLLSFRSSDDEQHSVIVVYYGLKLLVKLLGFLGVTVIRRFFLSSRGLDILSVLLKDWWMQDAISGQIYSAAFGDITGSGDMTNFIALSDLPSDGLLSAASEQLIMPDFLSLLNNLALNSMNVLASLRGRSICSPSKTLPTNGDDLELSLNVLHFINLYTTSIESGFELKECLKKFYMTKEWMEGLIELLSHLRMVSLWEDFELRPNFLETFERFKKTIASIFIFNLVPASDFTVTFSNMNDITKKIVLDSIFPLLFQHANEFLKASDANFLDEFFLEATTELVIFYNLEFLNEKFYIDGPSYEVYLDCTVSLIETLKKKKRLKISPTKIRQVKRFLGESLILNLLRYGNDDDTQKLQLGYGNDILALFKWLLYRQVIILQKDILDTEKIAKMMSFLLGIYLSKSEEVQMSCKEYLFNFLRTSFLIYQEEFDKIIEFTCSGFEIKESRSIVQDFFDNLLTRNDDENFKIIQRHPIYKHVFAKKFQQRLALEKEKTIIYVDEMISVMLNGGGKLSHINNVYVKNYEKDCEFLKTSIIKSEVVKYNRAVQDRQENIQFFISSYNFLKVDVTRLLEMDIGKKIPWSFTLDYVENFDRMRKRLIVENQLPDSEKLVYDIEIPIKHIEGELNFEDEFSLSTKRIANLEFGQDDLADPNEESFQIIDESLEVSNSDFDQSTYEDKNRRVIRSLYMGDQIVALWNISQINGLVPVEGLMILGVSYLYLIDNYFHCKDGNVIDVQDAPFDERDPYLHLINSQSSILKSENQRLHRVKSWEIGKLSCISKRQFLLRDIGIELFFSDGASILVTCISPKERDSVYNKLSSLASGKGIDSELLLVLQASSSLSASHSASSASSIFTTKLASAFSHNTSALFLATKNWKMGRISNFYYLMIINTLAGRTFNDLTQYPVFPWIIADYESQTLDLSKPSTFRDLSKPMGAQSPVRAEEFKKRYEALNSLQDQSAPPFHYGTHYSSAMIVTSFLIRLKPYVQSYLLLQGGKFDHADRLFNSIEKAWISASCENTSDVRELIPEFFFLPEFLVNSNHFEFGNLQDGNSSNDVELPVWAKGDPTIFISLHREALESSYVSANLHRWIELIFGHKQTGQEAVKALNVFHRFSYNGAINLDLIKDDMEKRAIIGMINNFGQTPLKVFNSPVSARCILSWPNKYLRLIDNNSKPLLVYESKVPVPIRKVELSERSKKWIGRPSCSSCEDGVAIRKAFLNRPCDSILINGTLFNKIHQGNITYILQIGYKHFLTASSCGTINVWKCSTAPSPSLEFLQVLRGHFAGIRHLHYSKSFSIALSLDKDGILIMWDLVRFNFMREFPPPSYPEDCFACISDDSGNIALLYSNMGENLLRVHTINGELLIDKNIPPGSISCLKFGSLNNLGKSSGNRHSNISHTYWSTDILTVCYEKPLKVIDIYELTANGETNGWALSKLQSLNFGPTGISKITDINVLKKVEIDQDDKLSRGDINLIIGDSKGKVYTW